MLRAPAALSSSFHTSRAGRCAVDGAVRRDLRRRRRAAAHHRSTSSSCSGGCCCCCGSSSSSLLFSVVSDPAAATATAAAATTTTTTMMSPRDNAIGHPPRWRRPRPLAAQPRSPPAPASRFLTRPEGAFPVVDPFFPSSSPCRWPHHSGGSSSSSSSNGASTTRRFCSTSSSRSSADDDGGSITSSSSTMGATADHHHRDDPQQPNETPPPPHTSSSSSSSSGVHEQRLAALEQSSRHFLVTAAQQRQQHPEPGANAGATSSSPSTQQQQQQQQQWIDLMEQWHDFLQDYQHSRRHGGGRGDDDDPVVRAATERLFDIYTVWNEQRQQRGGATTAPTNRPYKILLDALVASSRCDGDGPRRAHRVLRDWDAALGGDVARAPQDADFEQVLAACATRPAANSDGGTATATSEWEGAAMAQELVYERLELSYTWYPHANPKTYQRLVRCLARAVLAAADGETAAGGGGHHQQPYENGAGTAATTVPELFEALERAMDKLLQALEIGGGSHNSGSNNTMVSDDDSWMLALALSDAIQCWERASRCRGESGGSGSDRDDDDASSSLLFTVRRRQWLSLFGQLLAPSNEDLWRRLKPGARTTGWGVVEHSTRAVLQLHHRALLRATTAASASSSAAATTSEDLLALVEPMTHFAVQLDDLEAKAAACAAATPLSSADDDAASQSVRRRGWGTGDSHYYRSVIQAWGHLRKHAAETQYRDLAQQQQEFLLDRLFQQYESGFANDDPNVHPDDAGDAWNDLLRACLDAGCPGRVKELWDENPKSGRRVRKNQESFAIFLQSLAAKRSPDHPKAAMQRAEEAHAVLSKMVQFDRSRRRYHPTASMFASVMVAWSRSYHAEAGRRCQDVLEMMWQEHEHTGDENLVPGNTHYNALVTTWGFSRLPESFDRVLQSYSEMKRASFQLDLSSFTSVLFALARGRSVQCARQAENILDELEDQQDMLRPTVACYNSVIIAWSNSGDRNASQYCLDVYKRLLAAYERFGKDPELRPDSTTYCGLIEAVLPGKTAASHQRKPNSLLDIGDHAESILAEMEDRASQGLASPPDAKVYTSVMKAHWRSDAPDAATKAEAILHRMKEAYDAGNLKAKPDATTMTVLLQTLARSNAPNKAIVSWGILTDMRAAFQQGDIDMCPNERSYAAVLNACAFTRTDDEAIKGEAVRIALMVLNDITSDDRGCSLNEFVFRDMFQTIIDQVGNLDERTQYADVIFQRCCQEGFVNRRVVSLLKQHVPALYKRLPCGPHGKLQIPNQWTRRATSS